MERLNERLRRYTENLSPEQARDQLQKVYRLMYSCTEELRGVESRPFTFPDDEENIADELFFLCKKYRLEGRYSKEAATRLFSAGDAVWFFNGLPARAYIDSISYTTQEGLLVTLDNGMVLFGVSGLAHSREELMGMMKEVVDE